MARKSRLKTMRAVSALLLLAVVCLAAAGAAKLRQDYFLAGAEFIGWGFVPLTLLLGLTFPVKCKVKRTNQRTCGRWAYGLLFGCYDVAGHWTGKFRARLRLVRGEEQAVKRRPPAGTAAMYQVAAKSQPIKVTVEDGFRGICGFWIAVASLVATVIQVIAFFVH